MRQRCHTVAVQVLRLLAPQNQTTSAYKYACSRDGKEEVLEHICNYWVLDERPLGTNGVQSMAVKVFRRTITKCVETLKSYLNLAVFGQLEINMSNKSGECTQIDDHHVRSPQGRFSASLPSLIHRLPSHMWCGHWKGVLHERRAQEMALRMLSRVVFSIAAS